MTSTIILPDYNLNRSCPCSKTSALPNQPASSSTSPATKKQCKTTSISPPTTSPSSTIRDKVIVPPLSSRGGSTHRKNHPHQPRKRPNQSTHTHQLPRQFRSWSQPNCPLHRRFLLRKIEVIRRKQKRISPRLPFRR